MMRSGNEYVNKKQNKSAISKRMLQMTVGGSATGIQKQLSYANVESGM